MGLLERDAAIGEHVGKVPLAVFLEDAVHLPDVRLFVGREVEGAVRDDDVDGLVRNHRKVLGRAVNELDIGGVIAKLGDFLVKVLLGPGKAARIGFHADDLALLAHELCGEVRVAP